MVCLHLAHKKVPGVIVWVCVHVHVHASYGSDWLTGCTPIWASSDIQTGKNFGRKGERARWGTWTVTMMAAIHTILLNLTSPGIFYILPCIDKFTSVDIRIKSFDVPPQKVSWSGPNHAITGGLLPWLYSLVIHQFTMHKSGDVFWSWGISVLLINF